MNRPNVYFLGLLLLVNFSAMSQNICIGARGGISIPNLTGDGSQQNPLNTGYKSRLGPDFGLFAEFKVSKVFSIQPMVEYSSQGGKKDGMQAFPTPQELVLYFQSQNQPAPTYVYADYKSEAKLNYLMIPVLAKFGWNFNHTSPFGIYVDAGPFVGFLVSAKQVTSGSSNIYADAGGQEQLSQSPQSFDNTQDIKSQLHSANFGIEGNVGFSYQKRGNKIFLEGGGNYGFLNIQKGSDDGKNNTGAGTVTIGYAYCLGKK